MRLSVFYSHLAVRKFVPVAAVHGICQTQDRRAASRSEHDLILPAEAVLSQRTFWSPSGPFVIEIPDIVADHICDDLTSIARSR